jgi:hypothetical protein
MCLFVSVRIPMSATNVPDEGRRNLYDILTTVSHVRHMPGASKRIA